MEQGDLQRLYLSEEKGPVSRGLQWFDRPVSSRVILLLVGFCAGLIIINIVVTASSRGSRGNEGSSLDVDYSEGQENGKDGPPISAFRRGHPDFHQKNETYDGACPDDWTVFRGSCYYFSNLAKTWMEAQKMCQRRKARLTVINTEEEQVFLTKFAMKIRVWIGLSEIDGDWKWVDGTPFSSTPKKWAPGQPDEFFGHGLGGGEDCVQFNYSGDWNDEHCTRAYRYICEKKAVQ